ncbi:hypothetical protein RJ639_003655 [Escallonia herrerae]|uniref:Uncharacterized protein n=1 Tax=Escallonia herrerae TaxID=1293975 RepID=A0AA88W1N2_9ASTE|nr:hypothetical protein RJ639_003655 [Escallonia herrerae]
MKACAALKYSLMGEDVEQKNGWQARGDDVVVPSRLGSRRVNKPTIKAGAFALGQDKVEGSPTVVRGTILISGTLARVLIDPGSTHSYVASFLTSFAYAIGVFTFCGQSQYPYG